MLRFKNVDKIKVIEMLKNRLLVIFIAICLVLGTLPFAMGATPQKATSSSSSVYISGLYLGSPGEKPYQEYVKITNKGTKPVSMKGWKITDEKKKHTYSFPSSYVLKGKSTVILRSGKGKNTASTLYWNKGSFVWNNKEGDTAYLYNAQKKLVSKLHVKGSSK
jgi:hypothetical protein